MRKMSYVTERGNTLYEVWLPWWAFQIHRLLDWADRKVWSLEKRLHAPIWKAERWLRRYEDRGEKGVSDDD